MSKDDIPVMMCDLLSELLTVEDPDVLDIVAATASEKAQREAEGRDGAP